MTIDTRAKLKSLETDSSLTLSRRLLIMEILKRDNWVSLADRTLPTYENFVYNAVEFALLREMDESEYTELVEALIDSEELGGIHHALLSQYALAYVTVGAVYSLQKAGVERNMANLLSVIRVVSTAIDNSVLSMPFHTPDDKEAMHLLVVREITSDPKQEAKITDLAASGTKDCLSAFKTLDIDIEPSLASGVL